MMDKWSHLGAHSTADSVVAVFSLEIPDIPFHATERLRALIPSTARPIDPADHVQAASFLLWRYMCGADLAAIWIRRLALLSSSDVTRGVRAPSDERRLQQGMRHISILLEQYAISDEDKDMAIVLKGIVSLLSD
jgi:hypothetical protein